MWKAMCSAVRSAVRESQVPVETIHAIALDATCSLVAVDEHDAPSTVSTTDNHEHNVIMWMDHRAVEQARTINATNHPTLKTVGGIISPEMELPKLFWLRQHLPQAFHRAQRFFDLADYFTYVLSGNDTRSLCCAVCKWTYQHNACVDNDCPVDTTCTTSDVEDSVLVSHNPTADVDASHAASVSCSTIHDATGWDTKLFDSLGLTELTVSKCFPIGSRVSEPGAFIGRLTERTALALGLAPSTAIASGMIDAYAGALGLLCGLPSATGQQSDHAQTQSVHNSAATATATAQGTMCVIAGTSSCHLLLSDEPVYVNGVWGPYYNVLVPRLYVNEAGQSATGHFLNHILHTHQAYAQMESDAVRQHVDVSVVLYQHLRTMCERRALPECDMSILTKDLHMIPDFMGNRSPIADPAMCGVISGLHISITADDLAVKYLAALQAIAYGCRHIIETCTSAGAPVQQLSMCGGLSKNALFVQLHADITRRVVFVPCGESVLRGCAVMAAAAVRHAQSDVPLDPKQVLLEATEKFAVESVTFTPTSEQRIVDYHEAKYRVFRKMQQDFFSYRDIMNAAYMADH
eukprot:TRINITY_DN3587_c2_g2_i1.p1 TRINITY_DN3587_c2_g2~~TRINITY_DN3587_c2_g2_i1.p1  ORF type:complete len:577 (-),score=118.76 TRINITY_DN3587_c2_g2_i1:2274-4004(-)